MVTPSSKEASQDEPKPQLGFKIRPAQKTTAVTPLSPKWVLRPVSTGKEERKQLTLRPASSSQKSGVGSPEDVERQRKASFTMRPAQSAAESLNQTFIMRPAVPEATAGRPHDTTKLLETKTMQPKKRHGHFLPTSIGPCRICEGQYVYMMSRTGYVCLTIRNRLSSKPQSEFTETQASERSRVQDSFQDV